ncbi:MAG: regulatory protein RecX [Mariprofundaceae bacterium]
MSGREHCTAELRHKLASKGFAADCIEAVLARLKQEHYLSEERFAEFFLRSRIKRGEAPWLAAEKARMKGAEQGAVATALHEAEQGYDAADACRELLNQRDPGRRYRNDERQWQRQARFLRNKGYDAATILRVLNERPEE